jgi:hypothetical protein
MSETSSTHELNEKCQIITIERPEEKGRLGRSRRRWKYNMKILRKGLRTRTDWSSLAQNRVQWRPLLNKVMDIRVPWKAGNFLTGWATITFSKNNTVFHGDSNQQGQNNCVLSVSKGKKFWSTLIKTRVSHQEDSFDSPHTLHETFLDVSPVSIIALVPISPTLAPCDSSNGL